MFVRPGHIGRIGASGRRLISGAAAVATALPRQAAIIARWQADTIPAQADNTNLTSWSDSVAGLAATQTTAANQPKYRTSGLGGKPYVQMTGTSWMLAPKGGTLATTIESNDQTVLMFVRNLASTSFGFAFSYGEYGAPAVMANGTRAGTWGTGGQVPFADTGFSTVGYCRSTVDGGNFRGIINGTLTMPNYYGVTANSQPYIGGQPNYGGNVMSAQGELYDMIVWNVALSQAEIMQAIRSIYDKFGVAYPWASAPAFRMFETDSIGCNYNAGNQGELSLAGRVATLKGWPVGTYSHCGYVGKNFGHMTTEGPTRVDPIRGQLAGKPLHLFVFEYANQTSLSAAAAIDSAKNYIAARKAAGVEKVIFGTSTDIADGYAGYDPAKRAAYNTYDWSGLGGADIVANIHTNATIGVETACPATPGPYGPNFSDALHPADPGYAVLANLVAAAMP